MRKRFYFIRRCELGRKLAELRTLMPLQVASARCRASAPSVWGKRRSASNKRGKGKNFAIGNVARAKARAVHLFKNDPERAIVAEHILDFIVTHKGVFFADIFAAVSSQLAKQNLHITHRWTASNGKACNKRVLINPNVVRDVLLKMLSSKRKIIKKYKSS